MVGAGIQGVPPILRISQQYVTATAGQDLSLPQIGTFSHPYVQSRFTYQIDWGDYSTPDTGTTARRWDGRQHGRDCLRGLSRRLHDRHDRRRPYVRPGRHVLCGGDCQRRRRNSDAQTMQVVVNGQGPTFPDDGSPLNVVQARRRCRTTAKTRPIRPLNSRFPTA